MKRNFNEYFKSLKLYKAKKIMCNFSQIKNYLWWIFEKFAAALQGQNYKPKIVQTQNKSRQTKGLISTVTWSNGPLTSWSTLNLQTEPQKNLSPHLFIPIFGQNLYSVGKEQNDRWFWRLTNFLCRRFLLHEERPTKKCTFCSLACVSQSVLDIHFLEF